LQALLNVRARELEAVQQRFAVQQQRVAGLHLKLTEARDQVYAALHPEQSQTVEPMIASQRFQYVQFLKMQVTHILESIQLEERVLEKIREEMRVAYTKKRSLERLAEKQEAAYLKEIERLEEKETEDSIMARIGRHGH